MFPGPCLLSLSPVPSSPPLPCDGDCTGSGLGGGIGGQHPPAPWALRLQRLLRLGAGAGLHGLAGRAPACPTGGLPPLVSTPRAGLEDEEPEGLPGGESLSGPRGEPSPFGHRWGRGRWGGAGWQERAVGARGVRAEKTQDQDACVRDGKAAGPGGVHTLAAAGAPLALLLTRVQQQRGRGSPDPLLSPARGPDGERGADRAQVPGGLHGAAGGLADGCLPESASETASVSGLERTLPAGLPGWALFCSPRRPRVPQAWGGVPFADRPARPPRTVARLTWSVKGRASAAALRCALECEPRGQGRGLAWLPGPRQEPGQRLAAECSVDVVGRTGPRPAPQPEPASSLAASALPA